MSRHLRFISRTVMVQDLNVEQAYKTLTRLLTKDGIIETVKRKRYCEKPCQERQRRSFETCRRIYSTEMGRKIPSYPGKTERIPGLAASEMEYDET
ncbi:28S ribosomal protein S21 mitochondrial [Dissostichus eleginoides]|uniref:28S ribosomal protein S21 mitochondrial n=1 Tax=Dissostichus eleginoides TaxID=100907 RepID=A0AAD9EX82_DISEL|nr:28S ribosomal protein S21 mitochondrial [Dissostichus eleginoides]